MEQGKSRILESQPRSSIGDPIQSNIEALKKQRYGRPNTNSPFPYMQKRNGKTKQNALPSTAATSHLNQLIAINEDVSPTSNVKDIN